MTRRTVARVALAGLLGGCAAEGGPAAEAPSDYQAYTAVIREHFLQPPRGEHGLVCEGSGPAPDLTIGGQTRPLWAPDARRDSAAAAELPEAIAPVLTALRALDSLPPRTLAADSFAVGVAVRLHSDSPTSDRAQGADSSAPLIRFSRVAYSADGRRALLFATRVCPGKPVGEAEEGAHGVALLVPLERRGAAWAPLDPIYLLD